MSRHTYYPPDELAARRAAKQAASRPAIPSQSEYESREAAEFHRQLHEPERDSLADRKEACASFLDAMKHDAERIGERVRWILDGSFGYGAMQVSKKIARNKRMNRAAWFTHAVGVLDYRCPITMGSNAWKKLSKIQKEDLDSAVMKAVDDWVGEHGSGHGRY